jgi:hypothetical protein
MEHEFLATPSGSDDDVDPEPRPKRGRPQAEVVTRGPLTLYVVCWCVLSGAISYHAITPIDYKDDDLAGCNGVMAIGMGVGRWELDTCPIVNDNINYITLRAVVSRGIKRPLAYCTYKLLDFVYFAGIGQMPPNGMGVIPMEWLLTHQTTRLGEDGIEDGLSAVQQLAEWAVTFGQKFLTSVPIHLGSGVAERIVDPNFAWRILHTVVLQDHHKLPPRTKILRGEPSTAVLKRFAQSLTVPFPIGLIITY